MIYLKIIFLYVAYLNATQINENINIKNPPSLIFSPDDEIVKIMYERWCLEREIDFYFSNQSEVKNWFSNISKVKSGTVKLEANSTDVAQDNEKEETTAINKKFDIESIKKILHENSLELNPKNESEINEKSDSNPTIISSNSIQKTEKNTEMLNFDKFLNQFLGLISKNEISLSEDSVSGRSPNPSDKLMITYGNVNQYNYNISLNLPSKSDT
ncbi:hypothetical protein GVAV_001802 [Gurleya vavrai]